MRRIIHLRTDTSFRSSSKRALLTVCLGALLAFALTSSAQPQPGEIVTYLSGRDLLDRPHDSREWSGRRTMLVVMTDKDGGGGMREWFDAADTKAPPDVRRASIISLKLPFFATTDIARGRAKDQVPEKFWSQTWLDRDGHLAKALHLPVSRVPYVITIDDHGRVLASVHAPASDPEAAKAVWSSLAR